MNAARRRGPRSVLSLLAVAAAWPAAASQDEAWLARANVPDGLRPLLVLVDRGATPDQRVPVLPDYDPALDYGARRPAEARCDPARVYWRRGPGPLPDCRGAASIPLAGDEARGFHCEAGREPLARHGLFLAARAAQWRVAPGGGGWGALAAGHDGAVECRADRGRHGGVAGRWYAAQGDHGPWRSDPRSEPDWDSPPLSDSYLFLAGNYLNYLASSAPVADLPAGAALHAAAAIAARVTEGLDLAVLRADPAAPDGLALLLPPTPLPAGADALAAALATPATPSGAAPVAQARAVADWLASDPRAFSHACRAVSVGVPEPAADCTGPACAREFRGTLDGDLVDGLPQAQRAPAFAASLADPLALITLFAQGLQRDAGPEGRSRDSSPALPATGWGLHAAGRLVGRSTPRPRRRWPGTLVGLALDAPGAPPFLDAADRLGSPAARVLLTDLATTDLSRAEARLRHQAEALPRAALGLVPDDPLEPADLVEWAHGADALDADDDGERTESRGELGDPGLDAPALLRYAGEPPRLVAFVATNDGVLHALDGEDGAEDWAFMPHRQLPQLRALADPAETRVRAPRGSGPRLQLTDRNGDGRIDAGAGDQALVAWGLGGGARGYYALDVARPARPRVAWSADAGTLGPLGETLVPPVPARMRIEPLRQRGDWRVMLLTAGYDPLQRARAAAADATGGRIAVVAAATGERLWQAAAAAGPGVDLAHPELRASFAAPPRAVDADGDGLAERVYLLDVAGRLWRLDLDAERAALTLLARLGASAGPRAPAEALSFHAAPDVIYLGDGERRRLALAFGSGWTERPRDRVAADRFYVIFDELGPAAGREPLRDEDLPDVTGGAPLPPDAPGWRWRLDAHGAGEKTWGPSLTAGHRLRFVTYQPAPPLAAAPCGPPRGVNRLYTLDVRSGAPLNFRDGQPEPSVEIAGEAPPPPLRLVLPHGDPAGCARAACPGGPRLLVGGESVPLDWLNDPVRTSWRRLESAE